jgi:hypothetical protein
MAGASQRDEALVAQRPERKMREPNGDARLDAESVDSLPSPVRFEGKVPIDRRE